LLQECRISVFLGGELETHDPDGLAAGIVEFTAGVVIATGVFASVAAFIGSREMAVAYFNAPASRGIGSIMNRGELAAVYCFIFLYVACQGDGDWSVTAIYKL
jgi:putative oxidoreductase